MVGHKRTEQDVYRIESTTPSPYSHSAFLMDLTHGCQKINNLVGSTHQFDNNITTNEMKRAQDLSYQRTGRLNKEMNYIHLEPKPGTRRSDNSKAGGQGGGRRDKAIGLGG